MKVIFDRVPEAQATRDGVILCPGVNELPDALARKYLDSGLVRAHVEAPKGKKIVAKSDDE